MWLAQASQTTTLTAGSRHGTAAAPGRFPVFIRVPPGSLAPPREDARPCFSAEAQRPMTHDARAAFRLRPKCAANGFRESLARFRADRPPHQPHVSRANPVPVFGPRGRLRGSDITSGRHFDATLFPSSKRGSPLVGHRACRSATVVLNILNGPRGARAEFLAPHVTHGRKRPQSVARRKSRAAV